MHLSGAFSSWVAARRVAALLTVGVLSVGVSAWGAESAQALKDVQLTVRNDAKKAAELSLCATQHCPFNNFQLEPGQTASHTSEDVYGFLGSSYQSASSSMVRYVCEFSAHNPFIGPPFFKLRGTNPTETPWTSYELSEGETKVPYHCSGFDVVLHRKDDTSVKVMQITITHVPGEPLR